jgi:hypothetical protein
MADPRAAISFEGIKPVNVTYAHDESIVYSATAVNGSVSVGLAVSLVDDAEVTLAGDGEPLEGKLIKVEPDGFCVVQESGYMTLPGGTSATLTNGAKIVGDLLVSAEGYIRAAASGTAAELILARGRIIDNSDTEAVVVRL